MTDPTAYIAHDDYVPCACGCGTEIPRLGSRGRPQRYVFGHGNRGRGKPFWERVKVGKPDECWPWLEGQSGGGYGCLTVSWTDQRLAHREAWRQWHGSLPDAGYELHHICRNRLCCNPLHLEVVRSGEHRAIHRSQRREFCMRGLHRMEGANVILEKDSRRGGQIKRICRACDRAGRRRRYAAQKEAQAK